MSNNIKVLLFDLGGVIINISPQITIDLFNKISSDKNKKFNALDYRFNTYNDTISIFFQNYEKGIVDDIYFRNELRNFGAFQMSDQEIDEIWNKVILSLNQNLLKIIFQLREKYSIMILSNTNSIHRIYFDNLCREIYGKTFSELFDQVFYSYELKCRKPEKEIYEHVINNSNVEPYEIMFFDDMELNLRECEKLGMNSYHVKEIPLLCTYLSKFIV